MLTKTLYDLFQSYNSDNNNKNKKSTFVNLCDRKIAFEWLHAGTLGMPIAEIIEIIQKNSLKIPRTGHLGNWQEIFFGRAGALDHNGTVCEANLGFPYIYDMNQTENDNLDSGDTVYLAGSMVNKNHREILDIYTWDGNTFVRRSRENSYFVPFVLTPSKNKLISLSSLHKEKCMLYNNSCFFSDLILDHEELVKSTIKILLEEISTNKMIDISLSDLFDKVVHLDGSMSRAEVKWIGNSIKIENTIFENINQWLDALFLPMRALRDPVWFFNNIHCLPDTIPFMSLSLFSYLNCLFKQSHDTQDTVSAYLEWGAFGSAAYPPRIRGYFKDKAKIIKKISSIIIQKNQQIKPIFYLLLPSSIFNLLPSSAYPEDIIQVTKLFEYVLNEPRLENQKDAGFIVNIIEEITLKWWKNNKIFLSSYYKSRYISRRSVYHEIANDEKSTAVFLPQFYQLTLQQACMIVGGLFQSAKLDQEKKIETLC